MLKILLFNKLESLKKKDDFSSKIQMTRIVWRGGEKPAYTISHGRNREVARETPRKTNKAQAAL